MRLIALGIGAAVTLALPLLLDSGQLSIYILLGLTAIVTVGLSLLMGYAGQVSLGQAAFYGIGAYTAALLTLHGWPPVAGLVAAPLAAALAALVLGVPLLRLRGHHLTFATLAMQLILLSIADNQAWLGGSIGLQGIPQFSLGSLQLDTDQSYAYLTWVVLAVAVLLARNVIESRPGRALRALATSEVAAASAAIPVGRYKLAVFALSAGLAGLAGGIYAFYLGYVSPGSFPILLSVGYVVMVVVGGLGTIWGSLAGTAAVTLIVQLLNQLGTREGVPGWLPSVLSYAVYALLLIAVILYLPRGIVPALISLRGKAASARDPGRLR